MLPPAISREFEIFFAPKGLYRDLAEHYVASIFTGAGGAAAKIILDEVAAGVPIKDIYLQVFQPALYLIGRLWELNIISVAQEHLFTSRTQSVMAQLYPRIMSGSKSDKKLIATCVGSELHEIGIRMVADLFELAGWTTMFLGADTPEHSIADTVAVEKPHILAISTTMAVNLHKTESLIKTIKSQTVGRIGIMVGGYAFTSNPDIWKQVGADGFASDAEQALAVARALLGA